MKTVATERIRKTGKERGGKKGEDGLVWKWKEGIEKLWETSVVKEIPPRAAGHMHTSWLCPCRMWWSIPKGLCLEPVPPRLTLVGKAGLAAHVERWVCHCKCLAVNCSAYQGDLLSGSCWVARKRWRKAIIFHVLQHFCMSRRHSCWGYLKIYTEVVTN